MATPFEELHVLKLAETLCDEIWREVSTWKSFARDSVGGQLVRAIDSIGRTLQNRMDDFMRARN